MPILDLQRRLAEVGRIRLGRQVESPRSGKKHPAALDTFRLTSTDKARVEEAAKLYGGTVTKWDESPTGIPQWEVITKADRLPVIVPPSVMAFSQNYELWSGGGCQRRCDGITEFIGEQPCLCIPENRQCEPHTRLSVMLRDLKGLGVWRVDTTGYYAALEIKGQVETLEFFAGQGKPLPAILRLDQRVIKRPDEGTKRFVVPVLDVDISPGELLMGTVAVVPAAERPALTPVPDSGIRRASIVEQMAASDALQPSRRRPTTPEIKATGIAPRTAAQRGEPEEVSTGGHRQTEDEAYDAIEAAREAAMMTPDPPRMVTHGQLTALGTILSRRGYNDRSPEGVRARLDFCMNLVRRLMPGWPYKDRVINSSKEFTFDEAHALINYFKREDEEANKAAQQQEPADTTSEQGCEQPGDEPVDDGEPDEGSDERYYERMEREAEGREPDPDQMSLL
jgi:hypothetical protein